MLSTNRKLRVFLCHSSQDKPIVRELYKRLFVESWVDPWLDEEKLLPGQDWDMEIQNAVDATDVVIVCLSNHSVTREGYVQKEIKRVLDIADEKPEDIIFVIPLRLDDCPIPRTLQKWQFEDYFSLERKDLAYTRVLSSLNLRKQRISNNPSNFSEKRTTSAFSEINNHSVIAQENINKLILGMWDVRNIDGILLFVLNISGNSKFSINIGAEAIDPNVDWYLKIMSVGRLGIYTISPSASNTLASITLIFLDRPKLVIGRIIKFTLAQSNTLKSKETYTLTIVNKNLIKSSSQDREPNELIWVRR